MAGYTKLFASITESTVWREPDTTRLVWITMLALADQDGYIGASVPGLADRARVPLEACVAALETFKSPDEWSRTKDHDGRRIIDAEGGWVLLNHDKYRAIRDDEKRREQVREAVRRHRAKKAEAANPVIAPVIEVMPVSQSKPIQKHIQKQKNTPLPPKGEPTGFDSFWIAYPKKAARKDALRAFEKLAPGPDLLQKILAAVREQAASEQWRKEKGRYVPNPATWLNGGRWEDSTTAVGMVDDIFSAAV
jgi:hypothetical protein